jgi:hypothetical protein
MQVLIFASAAHVQVAAAVFVFSACGCAPNFLDGYGYDSCRSAGFINAASCVSKAGRWSMPSVLVAVKSPSDDGTLTMTELTLVSTSSG